MTKGTSKYVWLVEDDFDRAKNLVKDALEDRKADILKSLEWKLVELPEWCTIMCVRAACDSEKEER